MGVLVGSQASVMLVSALIDVLLLRQGTNHVVSLVLAVLAGGLLGLIHLPILLQVGVSLLFVLTAISQIILVGIWQVIPQVTGGSSGLFLPYGIDWIIPIILLLAIVGAIISYLHLEVAQPSKQFNWSSLKSLGIKAGAFGVPSLRLYVLGFLMYGVVLGAAGVVATRILGYLTVTSFGLPWALATVMIVLYLPRQPVYTAILLCAFYSTIRVVFRHSIYASPIVSNLFEMLFPVILLIMIQTRASKVDLPPMKRQYE
jgi:hypothetical protein